MEFVNLHLVRLGMLAIPMDNVYVYLVLVVPLVVVFFHHFQPEHHVLAEYANILVRQIINTIQLVNNVNVKVVPVAHLHHVRLLRVLYLWVVLDRLVSQQDVNLDII